MSGHPNRSVWFPILCSAALAVVGAISATAQPSAQSGEFQINSYTPDLQSTPSIAADGDGDFVVVWEQFELTAIPSEIFGRRFDSSGTALAVEFHVNELTISAQRSPWVARSANGPFVVVWSSVWQTVVDYQILARRFDAAGTPLAAEFHANVFTPGVQRFAKVGMATDGSFVVAWESYGQDGDRWGVFGRRFDAVGTAVGGEFQINDYTVQDQQTASVFVKPDRSFLVTWTSNPQDGAGTGVFARRYDSAGNRLAGEFQLSAYTAGNQLSPAVAFDGGGGFLAAWNSQQDGSENGVFARRFNNVAQPIGNEFQVNVYTSNDQNLPHVIQVAGSFVVVWQSENQDGDSYGVFARAFTAQGQPNGGEFQVNTFFTNSQRLPRAAVAGQRFVVTWSSGGDQDGALFGIFARRYLFALTLDIDGDGEVLPLTDSLLILRYTFGFRGNTLTAGAVGANCTRCDSTSIAAYLDQI